MSETVVEPFWGMPPFRNHHQAILPQAGGANIYVPGANMQAPSMLRLSGDGEVSDEDPNGHDLGFLSLSQDIPATAEQPAMAGGQKRPRSSLQDAVQPMNGFSTNAANNANTGFVNKSHERSPSILTEDRNGVKRRRGRPVGSKDRQPRVKRMVDTPEKQESETTSEAGVRKKPWKIILTAEQAIEIYQKRPKSDSSLTTSSCRSNEVAEQYGVNSKTIRDIWNRATWVKATREVWTAEEEAEYEEAQMFENRERSQEASSGSNTTLEQDGNKRVRGRPKGARDSRPRGKKKAAAGRVGRS
ncbi:hypothetical protein GUITHDRAFT_136933 [Guillardia theta CCMP2712]|uniref:Uncharacterized protein n=1 Tax=Guillardia theta (strain CCMP2712) TaxID=905079 RepID=L1JI62_GUITC|nr:hypothetical protein GUITHDRAFT_136933 [Guillardia theta CCMP2712]EKX48191.1 hypothetical protein GUITHDRAFT_136933 [Guillardia theta CCMP2712]|eukprot:XP_005835171.1 hypothetical protein GUITHDRAFT_136933 [Guillardia theta CCMP2712]